LIGVYLIIPDSTFLVEPLVVSNGIDLEGQVEVEILEGRRNEREMTTE